MMQRLIIIPFIGAVIVGILQVESTPVPVPGQTPAEMRIIHADDSNLQLQFGHMEVINEDMKLFSTRPHCRDACARSCKPIMLADTDQVYFICPLLKPPEKSIPEKFFAKMGFPVVLLIAVLALAALTCLVCCCRAVCCQNHSRSSHSSREGLHQQHVNDLTAEGSEKMPIASIEEPPYPAGKHNMRSTRVHDV